MDEYIKREDALDAVLFALVGTGYQSRAIDAIRDVPTANVAPIADTVRKMQERLKQYIDVGHYRPPTEICLSELAVANIIDQIAKEMLEGEG